ncbi:hypothetical protein VXQ18_15615 [Brucella abortus]|nr:hypothetical protein [Brucella abortus]
MKGLAAAVIVVAVLAVISLFIGVSDVSLHTLFGKASTDRATEVLLISRIPRTLAIILAGMFHGCCRHDYANADPQPFSWSLPRREPWNRQASAFCWLFSLRLKRRSSARC